ncbi:MAG: hypothetical protein QOJ92_2049 [Frankiales bacterium]|nr:hypothetical protein [Frankiales bacterium]
MGTHLLVEQSLTLPGRPGSYGSTGIDGSPGLQVEVGLAVVFFYGWILSLQAAVPGLVMGVIAAARSGSRRVLRSVLLALLVVAGVVGQFWALSGSDDEPEDFTTDPSWVQDGRLGYLLVAISAVILAVAIGVLLGLFRRRPPAATTPQEGSRPV